MKIIYKTHIDAAHKLPKYSGKCSNLHGHRWELIFELTFKGSIPDSGMYIDFKDIKSIINFYLDKHYDHKYLNDLIETPTAENLAENLFKTIKRNFKPLTKLQVWESPDCGVEYEEVGDEILLV